MTTYTSKHLDIGCGSNPRNPYNKDELFGLDQANEFSSKNIRQCQLGIDPIPFDDNYFDSVSAYDVIGHIPRQSINLKTGEYSYPFINMMSEIFRVLKPQGVFYALSPAFPAKEAFQDPTQVNIITDDTHSYFCGKDSILRRYGYNGHFRKISTFRSLPEEAYGTTKTSTRIKKIRYKILQKPISHIVWELQAIKEQ